MSQLRKFVVLRDLTCVAVPQEVTTCYDWVEAMYVTTRPPP